MTADEARALAREAKAAFDIEDMATYASALVQLQAWAAAEGWEIAEGTSGFVSVVRDGAAELLD